MLWGWNSAPEGNPVSVPKRTIKVKMPAWRYDDITAAARALKVPVAEFIAAAAAEAADAVNATKDADLARLAEGLAAAREMVKAHQDTEDEGIRAAAGELAGVQFIAEQVQDKGLEDADLIAAVLRRLEAGREQLAQAELAAPQNPFLKGQSDV